MSRSPTDPETSPSVSNVSTASVLESIPDAVVVADIETGAVVQANEAASDLFGCPVDSLVGRDHTELHPSEEPTAYREAFRRAFEDGKVERLENGDPLYIETATGDQKPVEINARRLESDGRTFVLGVFREISNRIRRERRIKEASTRLETLLDALPLPVSVLDLQGTVERWNQAATETFGYEADEVTGEFYPLFVDYDEFGDLLDQVAEGGIVEGYETTHRAKDGSVLDVELYARPLYEGDQVTGLIGTAVDVTEQKRRTQRLDVLHRVLRHNLRNRLAVIRGFANELVTDDESQAATRILNASDSLVDLAETAAETRKMVKRAQRDLEPLSLGALVDTLESASRPTTSIAAEAECDAVTVPSQSETVLEWLLEYAHEQHTGAEIDVVVSSEQRYVSVVVDGDEPLLDDGDRELVENGRETSLRHGSGLDMAQVYLVLTATGGAISTAGTPQAGSTLRIELPRVDADDG